MITLVIVISLPFLILVVIYTFVRDLYIKTRIELKWPNEKFILFTYSESENWSQYIEENIIPEISNHAVVINRTKQQNWKEEYPLELKAIEVLAGLEVNPIALIFRNGLRVRKVTLFEAFRDLKHGKDLKIKGQCEEIFRYVPNHP